MHRTYRQRQGVRAIWGEEEEEEEEGVVTAATPEGEAFLGLLLEEEEVTSA